jgi:serine phosphatase RsbU (regulator of sigma subunit)
MQGARLEYLDAIGRPQVVPIEDDPFTIGRSHGNTLSLSSAEISRHHAEIVKRGSTYLLRDLGSRAGTFANDETVIEHTLGHGDRIRIGRATDLRFLLEDTADHATHDTTSAVGDIRQTATVLEGLRALGTTKVLDQVLIMVIDYAITLSKAERGFIMLVSPSGSLEFKLGRSRGQVTLSGDNFQTSRKIPEQVFATSEPQLVADLRDELFAEAHEGTLQLGIRTVYCVPLKLIRYVERATESAEASSIGVLYLDNREHGALSSRSIQVGLETLAAEAAVAIENARLYRESLDNARLEREMRMAHEFQQALLPVSPPAYDYFSAAAEMVPCLSIGGDFYDYLDLDGSFGFVVGDVAGKGASAGLLGARVQEIFTHCAPGSDPATTLTTLNDAIVRKRLDARFVTIFYGILAQDGRLTYCNAGHNPPILVGRTGVRKLEKGGLIVGPFEDAEYEQEVVVLSPGDTLITFSDGVSEASNADGTEFGDDRILACVQAAPSGLGPRDLVDVVMAAVREFTVGEPQADDITVLVVRYQGNDGAGTR